MSPLQSIADLNTEIAAKMVATSSCTDLLQEHRTEHGHLWKLRELEYSELQEGLKDTCEDVRDHFEIMGRYNQIIREDSTSEVRTSPVPVARSDFFGCAGFILVDVIIVVAFVIG